MSEFLENLASTLITIFAVVSLTFSLIHFIPGDPVDIMLGDQATNIDKETLRKELGLDKPLTQQYTSYLKALIRFDLGRSIQTKKPVLEEILKRLPASFELALASLLFSLSLGIPFGVLCALRKGHWISHSLLFLSLVGLSLPSFWLGPPFSSAFSL